jgi:hypothetical protein
VTDYVLETDWQVGAGGLGFVAMFTIKRYRPGEVTPSAEWKKRRAFLVGVPDDAVSLEAQAFLQAIAEKDGGVLSQDDVQRRVDIHKTMLDGTKITVQGGTIVPEESMMSAR